MTAGYRPTGLTLPHPTQDQAEVMLRAVKTVAIAAGELSLPARNLMAAAQRFVLRTSFDIDTLPTIAPEDLARELSDPDLRQQILHPMVIVSLADGVPPAKQVETIERFARALGVESAAVKDIHLLAERHMLLFRLDFMRRSHLADAVRDQFATHELAGTVKALLGSRGFIEDPQLASKYHALGSLPEGTLGRSLYEHYSENGFAFPGEKHGFPEAGVYHDLTHVLSGYSTQPEGEVQVGAFTAGYRRHNPFYVLLFVVLTFSAGVNMTPLPQDHIQGIFADPTLAEGMFRAIERGSQLNTDLSDRWDFWPLMDKPLDEARRLLGVPPLEA